MADLPQHFISCDWGTSSFRLRLVAVENAEILAEVCSDRGIRTIHEQGPDWQRDEAFQSHLEQQLTELPANDAKHILLSGMATSSIGWRELPYALAPLSCDGSNLVRESIRLNQFEVLLISGVATERDIMRGEETEIIGILNHPDFADHSDDCLIILPGTHSKHVKIRGGQIIGWQTFMTGELFDALTNATILKQTTAASGEDMDAVREGIAAGFERGMESGLFHARVRGVLSGISNAANRGYLSGLLIGSELRHARGASPILIAGPAALREVYLEAIALVRPANVLPVDLPGSAAVFGHAFLLRRWHSAAK